MTEHKAYRDSTVLPFIKDDPRNQGDIIADAVTINETLTVTGVATFTAAPVFTAGPTGPVPVATLAATKTVTAAESGTTFFLAHATEFVTTLPAPAAGLKYRFVCKLAPSSASYTIVTASSANLIIGSLSCSTADDLGASDADADTITFVDGAAIVGDWVEVVSDGTSWYVSGNCFVAEGITLTKASF